MTIIDLEELKIYLKQAIQDEQDAETQKIKKKAASLCSRLLKKIEKKDFEIFSDISFWVILKDVDGISDEVEKELNTLMLGLGFDTSFIDEAFLVGLINGR